MKLPLPNLTRLCFTTTLLLLSLFASAEPQPPPANSEADKYDLINPPQPVLTEGKVEVAEFFMYTCPHCYAFENYLNPWVETKPNYVEFVHIPAVFGNDNGLLLAKVYYTAEDLGVLNKIHPAMFKAIHEDKRPLNNEQDLMSIFTEQGVSNEDFRKAFNSFSVDTKVRRAKQLTISYGITGVPEMAVHGKYRLTSGKAGGYTTLFKIVDSLVEKEHKQMTAPSQATPNTQKPAETQKASETPKTSEVPKTSETPKTSQPPQ
jgi:thiol:disulfide interchange protein DsbA